MDLASKAVFGIEGVKLSLEKEAQKLEELAIQLKDIRLTLSRTNQKAVLTELEDIKSSMSMCHTMIIYYHQVLEDLYKDYNTDPGMTFRMSSEDTEKIDFKDLTLQQKKNHLKVV